MSKQSGLGDNLYVGGFNASGDIGTINKVSGGPAALEVTDITQSGHARIGGMRDGGIDYTAYFDPTVGASHDTFAALPLTDAVVSYLRGTALGSPAASCVAKQLDYPGKLGTDGSFTFDISTLSNGFGVEWGNALTPGQKTDGAPANGASVDMLTVSTAFGWQAYAHVFAVTGTSVTLTLQDSADNVTFTNLAAGAFNAVTSAVAGTSAAGQRLQSGRTDTVRRFLRVVSSGTFTSATYAVVFVRNIVAESF